MVPPRMAEDVRIDYRDDDGGSAFNLRGVFEWVGVSGALDRVGRVHSWLEGDGLVQSESDPNDGRASLVSLTAAGQDRLDEVNRAGVEGVREIAAEFTEDELEVFASLLARFNQRAAANLETMKKRNHDHH